MNSRITLMEEEGKQEDRKSSDSAHPADISFNFVQMMAEEETKSHQYNGTPGAGRKLSKSKYNS